MVKKNQSRRVGCAARRRHTSNTFKPSSPRSSLSSEQEPEAKAILSPAFGWAIAILISRPKKSHPSLGVVAVHVTSRCPWGRQLVPMMALGMGGRLVGLYDEGCSLLPLILLPCVGAISSGSTGVFYLDGEVAVCYYVHVVPYRLVFLFHSISPLRIRTDSLRSIHYTSYEVHTYNAYRHGAMDRLATDSYSSTTMHHPPRQHHGHCPGSRFLRRHRATMESTISRPDRSDLPPRNVLYFHT